MIRTMPCRCCWWHCRRKTCDKTVLLGGCCSFKVPGIWRDLHATMWNLLLAAAQGKQRQKAQEDECSTDLLPEPSLSAGPGHGTASFTMLPASLALYMARYTGSSNVCHKTQHYDRPSFLGDHPKFKTGFGLERLMPEQPMLFAIRLLPEYPLLTALSKCVC